MTSLPVSERFLAVGITKCLWLPAVAATDPTRAEITAGTALQDEIVDMAGWDPTPNSFAVNTLGSRVSPSLTGRIQMATATLTFAASKDGEDVRTVLSLNTSGFILWADGGDVENYPAELFPVTVSALTVQRTNAEQEHRIQVAFSITNLPRQFSLPAAA